MNRHRCIQIRHGLVLLLCASLTGILVNCGASGGEEGPEWTVREGALTLKQDLLAGDDEAYYFGEINDLAVRGDGRIYVVDGQTSHVKVLAPDGTLRDSIGREGEGPGEFSNSPEWIDVARGDSIYVQEVFRMSVFAPGHSFVRRFRLPREVGSPQELLVPEQSSGYVALSSVIINPSDPVLQRREVVHYEASGRTDTLFSVPPPGLHIHEEGDIVRPLPIPFVPSAHLALGPEGLLHYGWGDRVSAVQYTLEGQAHDTVAVPSEPVTVTEADRERVLREMGSEQAKGALRRQIPSTKPAFEQFLVDDRGRYWFGRPTVDPDSTSWWVADPEAKRVVTATLPSEVQLMTVKDGRAYGRTTTEMGAPALVRYRIRISSNR